MIWSFNRTSVVWRILWNCHSGRWLDHCEPGQWKVNSAPQGLFQHFYDGGIENRPKSYPPPSLSTKNTSSSNVKFVQKFQLESITICNVGQDSWNMHWWKPLPHPPKTTSNNNNNNEQQQQQQQQQQTSISCRPITMTVRTGRLQIIDRFILAGLICVISF